MNAYIDESGNSDIDVTKKGATKYFIITAILVQESQSKKLKEDLEKISTKYFSGGQIKSSAVGNDDKRRLMILNDISTLDFSAYTLVVDKEKLWGQGFHFMQSFYKFLNGKLHSELYKAIPDLIVYHDSYGTDEFMLSLRDYIKINHTHDLFSESDFYMVKSTEYRQIQLADFICGAITRIYDKTKSQVYEKNYRELLSRIRGIVDEWPLDEKTIDLDIAATKEENEIIEKVAVHTANNYLGKHEDSKEPLIKQRVMFLRYLVYSYKYFNKNEYIYTKELRNHLSLNGIDASDYYIRSSIVAPLRDAGVLISSLARGYKIPVSKSDIQKYIQHSKSIIEPMVMRLRTLQKGLLLGTGGSIDIYADEYGFPKDINRI